MKVYVVTSAKPMEQEVYETVKSSAVKWSLMNSLSRYFK